MTRHVFIPGLTAVQRAELAVLSQTDDVEFHDLLDTHRLLESDDVDLEELLAAARAELDQAGVPVGAIIAHWDFPTSVLVPILAAERGLPAPALSAVLRCEHKYWSRLEQRASIPECTPGFAVFDPCDRDAARRVEDLRFPLFVKPVKSFSSQLSAVVHDLEEFEQVRVDMEARGNRLGGALDRAMERVELPPELDGIPGTAAMAEELAEGHQYAIEGSVHAGHVVVHGSFDMLMHPRTHRLQRLILPSSAPGHVLSAMIDASERYLAQVGFDDGCFNAEFLWDPELDQLRIVEVNTRMSQSHSDLFAKVDGLSNHAVALDVAMGVPPRTTARRGRFAVAEQIHISTERSGTVRSAPGRDELLALREQFPDTIVEFLVRTGDELGGGVFEHGGVHDLAIVYHGAADRPTLDRQHDIIHERLTAATVIRAQPEVDPGPPERAPRTPQTPSDPDRSPTVPGPTAAGAA